MEQNEFDAVICGGGLAGLTLAYQLRRECPSSRVAVVERTSRPLPEACHKVGESSVELSSHYLGHTLGLRDYLDAHHLHKNGLRFIGGDARDPIYARPEIGPAEFPIVPSFQLDRGKFENDMRGFVEEAGATLLEGVSIRDVRLGEVGQAHQVVLDGDRTLQAKWLIDATGRRRLLSKRLELQRESPNRSSSAWFRVKGQLKIGDLAQGENNDAAAWRARDIADNRWQSTVHLIGRGYWVWIIVLATGHTSIGIVASQDHHDFDSFNRQDRADAWLAEHEPALHAHLEGMAREDFRVMRDYSYLTRQAFNAKQRWACIGEAAFFVDPLYSLGGDFLAMLNSYTARLVGDDLAGAEEQPRLAAARGLHDTVMLLADDAARTLSRNGDIFAHADVLGAKLWWDFFNYWSFMCPHYFQEIHRLDAPTLERFLDMGRGYFDLNTHAQAILEGWASLKPTGPSSSLKRFVPMPMFPSVLAKQHVALLEPLGTEATLAKMAADLETGKELVAEVLAHALRDLGQEGAAELGRLIEAYVSPGGPRPHWDLPTGARFDADALPRRQRLSAMPEIGRDLERALGRKSTETPLSALWKQAAAQMGM